MSVISIDTALLHLRVDDDADVALIQAMLDAAEESASQYMQRRFYADAETLRVAVDESGPAMALAREQYEQTVADANAAADWNARDWALEQGERAFSDACARIRMQARGMVINAAIQAGCLLALGHLYENREDVVTGTIATDLPLGSQYLLHPYRTGLGV